MGRGAGRPALGFWPTLAFLLCSFPAGKAPPRARDSGGRASSQPWAASPSDSDRSSVAPPGGPASGAHGSLFLPRPAEGARMPLGTRGGGTLLGLHCKGAGREGRLGRRRLLLPRKGGPGTRPLEALRRGAGEARRRGRGAFPGCSPASLQTCPAPRGGPGAPLRSWPSPPRPLLRDPVPAPRGEPQDRAQTSPDSCLITPRVAPCLFLLCQKGREFQN